jgi:hypothetical protein
MASKRTTSTLPPPTDAQIEEAIEAAKARIHEQDWYPGHSFDLELDWEELGLATFVERTDAITRALGEIRCPDYDDPPSRVAAEPSCRGARILQFVWQSPSFGCEMFFRFAIHYRNLFVISLHRAKFPKKVARRK